MDRGCEKISNVLATLSRVTRMREARCMSVEIVNFIRQFACGMMASEIPVSVVNYLRDDCANL